MPAKPWTTIGSPKTDGNYVALLSYLPLKSYWRVAPFLIYTMQVVQQLATAPGLVGYSLLARPLSKKFWTLSAWENDAALEAFVRHPPHVRIMVALAPHLDRTDFLRWPIKGSQLPPNWDHALARFGSAAGHALTH
jgi:quinol monooxygenase YgiN